MTNRRRNIQTVIAAAVMALFLPLIASAQGNYGPWGRDRRDNDNGRNNRYNTTLRDAARRIDERSRDFQRHLDSALEHSRVDNSRREDNINQLAFEFRNAAGRFRSRVGDGRDNFRGADEAQRLIQLGSRIDRVIFRLRLDSRTRSDWAQISQDLRLIASSYGRGRDNWDPRR
ncbi:MAG: hypothetical protein QOJ64_4314 [Acidobacteriota bacterium]|nr:hypothetical protein [Acidobacteriota bacterium]